MPYTVEKEYVVSESKTTITDIDIPFARMVMILVKVSLAAIPAAIILGLMWLVIAGVFFGGVML